MNCVRFHSVVRFCTLRYSQLITMDESALLSALAKIDFRVGLITQVTQHPNADRLYVEQVVFGQETACKTVVSGLVPYFTPDLLLNRHCLFVYNMKPANMRSISSESMILVAHDRSQHDKVELLTPPTDAQPGDRVYFQTIDETQPLAPSLADSTEDKPLLNPKHKTFESVQPHLGTNAQSEIVFLGKYKMMIRGQSVKVASLVDAVIS